MKITLNAWKWRNGRCCGDREVTFKTGVQDQLNLVDAETGEELLVFSREELCRAMRAFDKELIVRLETA